MVADNPNNPCSLVTVPQGAAETLYNVRGSVALNGWAADRYLRDARARRRQRVAPLLRQPARDRLGRQLHVRRRGRRDRVQVLHASYFAQKDCRSIPKPQPRFAATSRRRSPSVRAPTSWCRRPTSRRPTTRPSSRAAPRRCRRRLRSLPSRRPSSTSTARAARSAICGSRRRRPARKARRSTAR